MNVHEAVKKVRSAFGASQEQFAERLHAGVRSVIRYESDQQPTGNVLARLWKLAKAKRMDAAADTFAGAFAAQIKDIDPSFIQAVSHHLKTALIASDPFIEAKVSADERRILKSVLEIFRQASTADRALMLDSLADAPRLKRDLWRASLLRELEDKLQAGEPESMQEASDRRGRGSRP